MYDVIDEVMHDVTRSVTSSFSRLVASVIRNGSVGILIILGA
jgi:hypothetical protein